MIADFFIGKLQAPADDSCARERISRTWYELWPDRIFFLPAAHQLHQTNQPVIARSRIDGVLSRDERQSGTDEQIDKQKGQTGRFPGHALSLSEGICASSFVCLSPA